MINLYSLKLEQIKKDPDQFAAFKSNISTVVKAGPGSGKTTVLSLKIMQLLKEKLNLLEDSPVLHTAMRLLKNLQTD